ncbi:hypothetical protein ABZ707_10865 [Streptomyces sp. NPDC006923]|uniref:hypothetical protein n=1 Tax=Streptomyces sp. NPDC006923 TaxID=3155355 RepID=UPI0033FB0E7E
MTRITKYVAATAVAAAVLAAPATAYASAPVKAPAAGAATVAPASHSAPAVRVVAPGERVRALPGVDVWLTPEGKYWSTPEIGEQFRSVVDGNLDTSRPGVSFQAEPVGDRYFLSGIYYGTHRTAAVKVVTAYGTVNAKLLQLPGRPGWGVWYTTSALPDSPQFPDTFFRSVTAYDAAGRTITSLPLD